ncbi:MAG TPA: sulfite exporter TauE/SafE family protein [Methylomirabilota bacterium]
MNLDVVTALSGLLVGTVVGMTGVGGGALMTPVLVLVLGVSPSIAIGTDLLFASATKLVGVSVHHPHGTVDWRVVKRLALGSLPAAALTLLWLHLSGAARTTNGVLLNGVAVAMLITALGMLFRKRLHAIGRRLRTGTPRRFKQVQPAATVVAGAILGVLVTLTSIGAGAIGTVALLYLYPLRLSGAKLVGTDLAHAIPLALVAGLGHLAFGHVDYTLLITLLAGSIPGVVIGAMLSTRAPLRLVQAGIAMALVGVATKMLLTG